MRQSLVTKSGLLWSGNKAIWSTSQTLALVKGAPFSCRPLPVSISKPQLGWLQFFGSLWFCFCTDELLGSFSLNTDLLNLTICWGGFYFQGEHLGPHLVTEVNRLDNLSLFLAGSTSWHSQEAEAELSTGCYQMHGSPTPSWRQLLCPILILLSLKVMAHKFIDDMQSRSSLNQDEVVIGDEAGE